MIFRQENEFNLNKTLQKRTHRTFSKTMADISEAPRVATVTVSRETCKKASAVLGVPVTGLGQVSASCPYRTEPHTYTVVNKEKDVYVLKCLHPDCENKDGVPTDIQEEGFRRGAPCPYGATHYSVELCENGGGGYHIKCAHKFCSHRPPIELMTTESDVEFGSTLKLLKIRFDDSHRQRLLAKLVGNEFLGGKVGASRLWDDWDKDTKSISRNDDTVSLKCTPNNQTTTVTCKCFDIEVQYSLDTPFKAEIRRRQPKKSWIVNGLKNDEGSIEARYQACRRFLEEKHGYKENVFLEKGVKEWDETGWTVRKIVAKEDIYEIAAPGNAIVFMVDADNMYTRIKVGPSKMLWLGRVVTPIQLRHKYFSEQCMTIEQALKKPKQTFKCKKCGEEDCRKDRCQEPEYDPSSRTFTCQKWCPAIEFVEGEGGVEPADRSRCPYKIRVPGHDGKWTIAWDAPMGSGKTHSLREMLKEKFTQKPDLKVLFVSVRIALTLSFMDDFKSDGVEGFVNYQDCEAGTINDNRLVIQIDSINRLPFQKTWDVVVVDESQSLTAHFSAESFRNPESAYARLQFILNKAQHVIFADADMNKYNIDRSTWFLEKVCKRKQVVKINSVAPNDFRNYFQLQKSPPNRPVKVEGLEDRVIWMVNEGYKVVLVSNTKAFVKNMHRMLTKKFPEKKGLCIYSEAQHSWKDCVEDNGRRRPIDKTKNSKDFEDLVWFGYSPVVSPGVSFDTKKFDVLVAQARPTQHAAGVRYYAQLVNRVRFLNIGTVLFDIPEKGHGEFQSTNIYSILNELNQVEKCKRFHLDARTPVLSNGLAQMEGEDDEENARPHYKRFHFNMLWCRNEAEKRDSFQNFRYWFKNAKISDGAWFGYLKPKYQWNNNGPLEEINEDKRAARDELADEGRTAVLDANPIDAAAYKTIQELNSSERKAEQVLQCQRYELCYFNGLKPEEAGDYKAQLDSFCKEYKLYNDANIDWFCISNP